MANDTLGYGCGDQKYGKGYFGSDVIYKTTDKGKTWKIIYKNLKEDTFGTESIICRDENHILAEGSWQKLLYSTDGGETWEYLEIDEGFTIGNCVAFAGSYPLVSSWGGGIYRYEEVTSVAEPSGSGISIVPNPAGEYIEIGIDGAHLEGGLHLNIEIYDVLGNVVWNSNSVPSKTLHRSVSASEKIDISQFPHGIYFVRIGDRVEKFVKR